MAKGSFPGLALYSGPTPDPWSCPGARSQLWLGFLRRRRSRATKASRSVPDHSSVQSAASLPQTLGVLTTFPERKVVYKMEWKLAIPYGWDKLMFTCPKLFLISSFFLLQIPLC